MLCSLSTAIRGPKAKGLDLSNKTPSFRLTIGKMFVLGFLALTFLICLRVILDVAQLSELESRMRELTQHELPEARIIGKFRTLTSDLTSAVQSILMSEDTERFRHESSQIEESIRESLQAYRDLYETPIEEQEAYLLDDLDTGYRALQEATTKIIALVVQKDAPNARALFLGRWTELRDAVSDSLARLSEYEIREVGDAAIRTEIKIESARKASFTLALIGIFLSITLGLAVTFSLTRPMVAIRDAIERVKRGDPVSPAEICRTDNIDSLTREFNEMLGQLHRSFENACHEIRTPLTILRGEAEVALRGPAKTGKEYQEALRKIVEGAEQMGRLVDDFTFLERSDIGEIGYTMETVSVPSLLEEVVRQSRGVASLQEVNLELHLDVDVNSPLVVRGDSQRLHQLFLILMDNAIKYTDAGGKVRAALTVEGGAVKVRVSDTGIGISEKDLPSIFQRFYRADSARQRRAGGTGLGLAIARSIVQVHHGKILVESKLGRGTVVSVILPGIQSGDEDATRAS